MPMISVNAISTLHGVYEAGADKSMTVRAILLGAISQGVTVINNALISLDTLAAVECARALGANAVVESNKRIVVKGTRNIKNAAVFDCKNSATTARLLIGLLAGLNVQATVTGDKSLQKRPMSRVVLPLINRGASIQATSGRLPVYIQTGKLCDYEYNLEIPSAQVKSALILSGVAAGVKTVINEKYQTRAHTENMLPLFGGKVSICGNKITVLPCEPKAAQINIPTDPSSAAYYIAAGLLKGEVTVKNVMLGVGRRGFYDKLVAAGADISFDNQTTICGEPCFDVTARKSNISAMTVDESELPSMIDEIPVLALIGSRFNGLTVKNAAELKVKESDRLTSTAQLIKISGGTARVENDDLIVLANAKPQSFSYNSDDHRLVMTAFIAMITGAGGKIDGENAAEISLPEFYSEFYRLRAAVIGADVSRSLSGDIHKFLAMSFGDKNFGYECVSLPCEKVADFVKKSGYRLINVTIPYKQAVTSLCELTPSALLADSVNCIINGKGYTFDGDGLLYALYAENIDVKGKSVLIYGAGGAGRSIAVALARCGATVYMKNRTAKRLNEFIKRAGKQLAIKKHLAAKCDIVINASSLKQKSPISKHLIKDCQCVVDINYGEKTALISLAEQSGVKCFDGLSMLFYQAYLAESCLHGKPSEFESAFELYKTWRKV